MNDGHPRRRVTRVRSLYRRRCRRNVIVVVAVEGKFRRRAFTTLSYARPMTIVAVVVVFDVVVVVADDVSSAAPSLRAPVGCTRCPRKRLACPGPRHSRCRVLARSVARSSIRARARRRVTLVKFQTGIWVKTSPPRNARRNADTRERRIETKRTRNGERQRRERGRESGSPVSPPSLPGERLWRRPGSHCCFPRRGVTRGGWLREGRGDYLAASPSAQDQPHGTGA